MNKSLAALLAVAATSAANAAIQTVTGQVFQISPPLIADFPTLVGPLAQCWDEQQGFTSTALLCDMTLNPSNTGGLTPGPVGGTLNSHFIHFTHNPVPAQATGTITFDGNIVGVMLNDTFLDLSDAQCGAGGTLYPTGQTFRGFAGSFLSINLNVLFFDFVDNSPANMITQVRVLTQPVPAPGALALGGFGLMALARRRR